MTGESHREKLDRLNEAVTDLLLSKVNGELLDGDGNPVPLSNDDLRVIQAQLKNNSISAAALPDHPMERMQRLMQGLRVAPGHLEARQKALPHLLPALAGDSANSAPTGEASDW